MQRHLLDLPAVAVAELREVVAAVTEVAAVDRPSAWARCPQVAVGEGLCSKQSISPHSPVQPFLGR